MDTVIINISELAGNVGMFITEVAQTLEVTVNELAGDVKISIDELAQTLNVTVNEVLGVNGLSAYQIALQNGFVGTEAQWLLSLKGASGTAGGVFVFLQSTPLSVWNVNHGLNYYPNVSVVDSSGQKVYGDIRYIDINNIQLSFAGAFSGNAYLS